MLEVIVCISAASSTTCVPACGNSGTCLRISTSYVCQCPCGWTGSACTGRMAVCILTHSALFLGYSLETCAVYVSDTTTQYFYKTLID